MDNLEYKKIIYLFDKYAQQLFYESHTETENKKDMILTSPNNVVGKGDVIARTISPDMPEFNDPNADELNGSPESLESDYVSFNTQTNEFTSKIYGFAVLKDKKLKVIPLTWYSKNKLEAYLYINPTISKRLPTLSEIKKIFDVEKLVHIVEDYNINYQIDVIKEDTSIVGGGILIAEGSPPENGVVELVELRKTMETRVGKELENGRIDYKEKMNFMTVTKGELIAEKIPEVLPKAGVDVFGETIEGKLTGESPYRIGKKLIPQEEGSNLYVAEIDGVIDIVEGQRLNVEERLVISGDINLNTGNIHFPGIVEVTGNIQPGFKVEATKGITVRGNIEDAIVSTDGKLVVDNGILGKESCKVFAKENIIVRFIQNAEVTSEKDIKVIESVVQGKCFAKEFVYVQGRIVGGEIYGRFGIETGVAGSASETKTLLIVGKDPDVEKQIDEHNNTISEKLNELKDYIDEITQYFGENILAEVKSVINTLPDHRKKQLLSLLQNIKKVNETVNQSKIEREKLKASLALPKPPTIKIKEEIFPGVTIRIINSVKKIDSKFNSSTVFKEDPKSKVIFWD